MSVKCLFEAPFMVVGMYKCPRSLGTTSRWGRANEFMQRQRLLHPTSLFEYDVLPQSLWLSSQFSLQEPSINPPTPPPQAPALYIKVRHAQVPPLSQERCGVRITPWGKLYHSFKTATICQSRGNESVA